MPITTNRFPSRRPRTHRAYIPHPTFPRAPGWPITTNRFPSRRPRAHLSNHGHAVNGRLSPQSHRHTTPLTVGGLPQRPFPWHRRTHLTSTSSACPAPASIPVASPRAPGATTATVVMRFAARRAL